MIASGCFRTKAKWLCLITVLAAPIEAVEDGNLQLASFDQVWQTVRDRHWDQEKVGAAWDRARDEFRPQAERARTPADIRPVIERLLATLRESHFGVIPAEAYASVPRDSGAGNGEPAFEFRVLDGEAVVTRGAGDVKPGWTIVKAGGKERALVLSKTKAASLTDREAQLHGWAAVQRLLRGEVGRTEAVTFGLPENGSKELDVPVKEMGHIVQFGNLPPLAMQIESKRLEGNIAYFRFNIFLDPEWLQGALGTAVSGCSDCAGFILDLRGNLGGLAAMTTSVAGWFVPAKTTGPKPGEVITLGTVFTKTGKLKLAVNPRQERFGGKLAALVDPCSVSSAEILAAGLKDLGRARVFGEVTQGAALPSEVQKLPNGDRFQFAVADYVSVGGGSVEGPGVVPDVIVRPTRNDYLASRDLALEAAMSWIKAKESSK